MPLASLGRVWLVGCGNLGRAMLDGWLAAGLPPTHLTVVNPTPRVLPSGVTYAPHAGVAGRPPDVAVLAVKPQKLGEAAFALAPHVAGKLVLSVLAGATNATIAAALPGARIIRAIPNTPVRIRSAVTLLIAAAPAPVDMIAASALMGALGHTYLIEERHADLASALTASSPAFLFRFIEALAAAGEDGGLDADLARRLALQSVAGSAALAAASPRSPAELRLEVTSPNGMTQAGLAILEQGGAFTTLIVEALRAAAARSAELGQEAAR